MISKKKVQKKLGKRCPECDGVLQVVSRSVNKQGVLYTEKFIECMDCDYKEKIKNNHRDKNEDDLELGW